MYKKKSKKDILKDLIKDPNYMGRGNYLDLPKPKKKKRGVANGLF